METEESYGPDPSDKSWALLQSLICLLREKRILGRQDIEDLCADLKARASSGVDSELSCTPESLAAAAGGMAEVSAHLQRRCGGRIRYQH